MGKKKAPTWVNLDGAHDTVYCERCGDKYKYNLPAPLRVVAAILKAYSEEHASCAPRPAAPPAPPPTPEQWLAGVDTGTSSRVLWAVMMKRHLPELVRPQNYPHDPADFGRCYRLLKLFPEWRARLPEVASGLGPVWRILIANWQALEALYEEELPSATAPKLYALMKALQKEAGDG